MNILITGGAGFIGSNFTYYWLEKHPKDKIKVLDSLTYAGNFETLRPISKKIEFIEGDINNRKIVSESLKGVDTLVHFAAESHVDRSVFDPSTYWQTNVHGTLTLLEEAEKAGVTRFHQISTDEVYGELPLDSDLKFTEKTPYSPRPDNLYALSKAEADRIVMDFYEKTKMYITISNCSNNYGPFQFPEKFAPIVICNLIDNIKVPLHGDGRNVRDWIHTRDHSSAIELILEKGKKGETYLVGSNNDRSNGYIAKKIVNLYGANENMIRNVSDRHSNDRRYAIDATKIIEELGWKPKIGRDDFNEGLKETIKWYRENQDWWRPLLKRKAMIMDSSKTISAYISLDRESGKTKFVFGKVEKNDDSKGVASSVGKIDTEKHFVEQNLIRYEIVIRNLESKKWYQNSSEKIKKEIKSLGINPSTFGYVEDLAGREDHLDGDTILSLEKIEHGDPKYGIYGIGSWFEVENTKKEKRMEGYYSWGWGPKSGAKLLVLIKRRGEITHLATQRELKFPTGAIEYTLPGGLPTLNESVLDFIVRSLQKDLNLSVANNDAVLDQIISLGRLNPDSGMTNNKPNLYAIVVDLSNELYTDVKKGDKFEEDEGIVLWPIEKLSDLINKCDDAYFLSALTRLNLMEIKGLKL
ncbi:dTDP-glucose 4,6-dehydratase [Candidatus Woesebacteria bacterium RIFOXYC1_FULL_31_51]|uniref:dTDP-glucose 4,6-dehydratase n=1 Tax=Candidatus Woesebacteria bacterium GW2011_GWC2_31_9 TaxID=1618586 RepID=A0A0G0BJD6_9BACT|nr:MAG: dTDP-glucose 4,6-dehydratase, dTDP-glucose 4,6-dehydratase [Candidatus Woesebacteria bacterium GW2011_GWF1_31_35]KKP23454.1 MAG: dTDP-glucose 4,6-dehydratase [Candidatus Woesebacteria bacterium GW2011_GWC1_30_29]KKP26431.1 MAG: dTDP-glucose 4,6-dehydratase [Candidatus Woesebacteria bacterium GW2011_GWD1_31_12]KKP27730.1 MAG: dTDP-glucose 4,6-dehydratase [Candidatus Woesebacteria bacterium GW2011_GWB1_31_29]KKP31137.1 MAG: dTDP-glucose 4,6-dehydratase [Candidatus Woesebacteria bacterium 